MTKTAPANIVSFSGGKDSTAMLLMLIEKGYPIDKIVFADTLEEFPEMYEYIAKVEKYINRKIIKVSPKTTFSKWFYGLAVKGKHKGKMRGFPPNNAHCYWSREVKDYTLKKYCYGQNVYLGIAYDEPNRIKEHPKFNALYPLNEWKMTEADCLSFLRQRDLHNSLYDRFQRLGCWFCPKQRKTSLKSLWQFYPYLWLKLKVLANESPCGFGRDLNKLELEFKGELI